MRLVPISSDNVPNIWFHVKHLVDAACAKAVDDCDPAAYYAMCKDGRQQLWVAMDQHGVAACVITGIWTCTDGRKVCELGPFAGVWNEHIEQFLAQIEEWAKAQGCYGMRSYSRLGMRKLMPKAYKTKGIALERKF